MVGEIGGAEEEKAAAFIGAEMTKPVVAYIAGFTAPPGKTMGHAGAIISGSAGTARAKKDALEAKGVRVGTNPTEVARLAAEVAGRRRLRAGRPGAPKSARASEVVYGVKVLEKMLEGPPPRVDPQAVANPPP